MITPRELAERIMTWTAAGIDPIRQAMLMAAVDCDVYCEAMRIVQTELIPAESEREIDEELARLGPNPTNAQLDAKIAEWRAQTAAEKERPHHLGEADWARIKEAITETAMKVLEEYPDEAIDGDKFERLCLETLARRAAQ